MPFRSGGSLTASKIPDAQAAYESANTLQPTVLGGVNFVLHAAGWLEGGLTMGYEKFVMDLDQCGMMAAFAKGVDLSPNGQALDAIVENGPGQHFLGTAHTLANFESAFFRSSIADNNSFEQWEIEGSRGLDYQGEHDLEEDAGRIRGSSDRRDASMRSSGAGSSRRRRPSRTRTFRQGAAWRCGNDGASAGWIPSSRRRCACSWRRRSSS